MEYPKRLRNWYYYYMEPFIVVLSILQSFAISLGVGSSTLAITNFFVAIADGRIDENERKMMGVVYVVLRVAMVAILITTFLLIALTNESFTSFTGHEFGIFTVVGMLYLNAILMTKHLIPNTIGPALQAGSWYTLGTLLALQGIGMTGYSYLHFLIGYVAFIFLAVSVVNGIMAILKSKREEKIKQPE